MNMRDHRIWARTATLLFTLLFCISALAGCDSSEDVFALMEEGKYEKAISAYRKLSSDERKVLTEEAEEFAKTTMDAFSDGSIDTAKALERLDALRSLRISSLTESLEESVITVLQEFIKTQNAAYLSDDASVSDVLYKLEELYDFFPFDELDEDPIVPAMEAFAQLHADTVVQKLSAGELNFDTASTAMESIRSYQSIYDLAISKVEELRQAQAVTTAYNEGKALYEAGNYEEAVEKLRQIPSTDQRYQEAQSMIDSALATLLTTLLENAQSYADQEQFDAAISLLRDALGTGLDDAAINRKITEYTNAKRDQALLTQLESAVRTASRYADDNRYEEAFATIQAFIDSHYSSASDYVMEQAANAYAEIENRYVDMILLKVATLRTNEKYLEALNMVNNCLKPNNARINQIREVILSEKPTYLCEMGEVLVNYINYRLVQNREPKDSIGNTYAAGNVYEFYYDYYGSYCEYYLGYKYDTLTGKIAVCDTSENYKGKLVISGDGKVLKEISLSRAMTPVEIEIDVSAVNFLTIEIIKYSSSSSGFTPYTLLVDFAFEPTQS